MQSAWPLVADEQAAVDEVRQTGRRDAVAAALLLPPLPPPPLPPLPLLPLSTAAAAGSIVFAGDEATWPPLGPLAPKRAPLPSAPPRAARVAASASSRS